MTGHAKTEDRVSLGSRLCLACGICCQGIFFFHDNDPAKYAIAVDRDARATDAQRFPSTCALYRDGCLIHDNPARPRCCRESQCQLLKRLLGNEISVEDSLSIVARIKALLSSIRARMPAVDDSRPFIEQAMDFGASQKERLVPPGHGDFLMDLAVLELFLARHIVPIEGV